MSGAVMRSIDIIVLSFNRPKSLTRLIDSLSLVKNANVSVHVSDDNSPRFNEIEQVVNDCRTRASLPIILHSRNRNLGYDGNLIESFSLGSGELVMLMSDDDYFDKPNAEALLSDIQNSQCDLGFVSYSSIGATYRSEASGKGQTKVNADLIYNAILFSGLVFNRSKFANLATGHEFLRSCIYTQVFLVAVGVFQGCSVQYFTSGRIVLGNDGESFFGKNSASSNKDLDLRDRSHSFSNFHYQRRLLALVQYTDRHCVNGRIFDSFFREYFIRLAGYVLKLEARSRRDFLTLVFSSGIRFSLLQKFLLSCCAALPNLPSSVVYRLIRRTVRRSG
jgi:glycosyltransferase involved in cell wall biosynthesis